MSTSLPTVVLLPGSFAPSYLYFTLQSLLWKFNYPTHRVSLPSIIDPGSPLPAANGSSPQFATLADDAAHVHDFLSDLVEKQNKEVILVTHSYSGIVGTEAVRGLTVKEREEKGLVGKGGVSKIVYVTSIVPEVGKSVGETNPGGGGDYVIAEENGALLSINASAAAPFICSDLPPTEAVFWTEAMGRHSAATFAGNLTFAAWKYVDVTYVHTSLDQIIPLQVQKSMVQKIDEDLKEQGKSVRVFERAVGHMVPLIHPDWIATIIRRVNGEDF